MKRKHNSGMNRVTYSIPDDLTENLRARLEALPVCVKSQYLKEHLMSKFVSSDTDSPELRRSRAVAKWLETERKNEVTNERLSSTPGDYNILPRVTFDHFVAWSRKFIIGIIGEVPPEDCLIGMFSGGASTSRPRTRSHPATKYVGKAHVTARALEVWESVIPTLPVWHAERCEGDETLVTGNVLFTVPKKTDIDRVACKEPDINMWLQKGLGSFLRRMLKRHGVDLNDQAINRSLAQVGSVTNELMTLDLSSASDSVTRELVFTLLPIHWYTLLDSVRSPVTVIDGEEHVNEMFSSMGNGFTFELESLLFFTIAKATAYFRGVPGIVSVYGDDIIAPSELSTYLPWVLGYFGFSINNEKSFTDGPIRESCGGHYYNGFDITPFYIREPIKTLPSLIDVANKLRQWAGDGTYFSGLRRPRYEVLDPDVEDIWLWLKSFIPDVLWGGVDTTFKYQLVSNDEPRYRLVEEHDSKRTGIGGYLHWLNATWERENAPREAVVTSRHTAARGTLRVKRARVSTVDRLQSLWLHEL